MKPEYYKASDGWRWRVKANSGVIVAASSEAFARKWNAKRNYRLIMSMRGDDQG